jgi:hypothetical protein
VEEDGTEVVARTIVAVDASDLLTPGGLPSTWGSCPDLAADTGSLRAFCDREDSERVLTIESVFDPLWEADLVGEVTASGSGGVRRVRASTVAGTIVFESSGLDERALSDLVASTPLLDPDQFTRSNPLEVLPSDELVASAMDVPISLLEITRVDDVDLYITMSTPGDAVHLRWQENEFSAYVQGVTAPEPVLTSDHVMVAGLLPGGRGHAVVWGQRGLVVRIQSLEDPVALIIRRALALEAAIAALP